MGACGLSEMYMLIVSLIVCICKADDGCMWSVRDACVDSLSHCLHLRGSLFSARSIVEECETNKDEARE